MFCFCYLTIIFANLEKRIKEDKNWCVLYVKSRQEFKVSERLEAFGIETYVPFKNVVRQWSDRKKKVKVVLLPSIVLVKISLKHINQVFTVPGTVRFLFENGIRAIVSDIEIINMKKYLAGNMRQKEMEVIVGDKVVVPSLNQEAEVIRMDGKRCFARLNKLSAIVSFKLA